MKTMSKSFVVRAALGLATLAGVVAAVPADARPFYGHGDWGRGRIERVYAPAYYPGWYPGFRHEWRPVGFYGPAPVVVWHGHYHRW